MTHPDHHAALSAALVDLRQRLSTGWRAVAVSGAHGYRDSAGPRHIRARIIAGVDGVQVSYDDSGEGEPLEWWPVTVAESVAPGFPIDALAAAVDTYAAGAPGD